jgi:hypothetical protein
LIFSLALGAVEVAELFHVEFLEGIDFHGVMFLVVEAKSPAGGTNSKEDARSWRLSGISPTEEVKPARDRRRSSPRGTAW